MKTLEPRRFSIADALILIAGLAGGLGLIRMTGPGFSPGQLWDALVHPREGWSAWYAFGLATEISAIFGIPLVAGATPACLLVQVVAPRPRWRRLARQPGFIACLIATAVVAAAMALGCVRLLLWGGGTPFDPFLKVQLLGGLLSGAGIASSWATMRLCGLRRPRRSWTDALGRALGAAWIALGAISVAYIFLTMG
jgi:hypothetical protein